MGEQPETEMDARKRVREVRQECKAAFLGHENDGWICGAHAREAIEAAVKAERDAIADFVSLYGSESGYTHVGALVAAIRARGSR